MSVSVDGVVDGRGDVQVAGDTLVTLCGHCAGKSLHEVTQTVQQWNDVTQYKQGWQLRRTLS